MILYILESEYWVAFDGSSCRSHDMSASRSLKHETKESTCQMVITTSNYVRSSLYSACFGCRSAVASVLATAALHM